MSGEGDHQSVNVTDDRWGCQFRNNQSLPETEVKRRSFGVHRADVHWRWIALRGANIAPPGHWLSLMPAMMISGWGQGVIACSLRGSKSENRLHQGFIWRCIASLLITVICWQVQSYFGGNHGFACAFALLVDLSLLGLIFVKVTCADHESSGTGD